MFLIEVGSYFLNPDFFETVTSEIILKKATLRRVFVNMNLVFSLAVSANSLVDSFLYNVYVMFRITNLIELWCMESWYVIISKEITVQSSAMDFCIVTF